jgi:hypothetical protein
MPDNRPIADANRWIRSAAAAQGAALGLILIGCLFAPRSGGAVLLIPLTEQRPALGAIAGHISVLRAGTIPGSLLVLSNGPVPVIALLRQGVLALAAPSNMCATVAPERLQRNPGNG